MKRFLFLIALVFITSTSFSQVLLGFADYKYNNLNYTDAIPLYKYYLAKRDSSNKDVIRKLATSYRLTNQSDLAEPLFGKLTLKDSNWSDIVNYAEMMMTNKKYDQVFRFVNRPEIAAKKDLRLLKISNSIKHMNDLVTTDTGNVRIALLPFNSEESDFCPAFR